MNSKLFWKWIGLIPLIALAVMLGWTGIAFGQSSFYTAEDAAALFQVKYTGPNTATMNVVTNLAGETASITLVDGSDTTTITFTSAMTVGTVISTINANTNNTDEALYWEAVLWGALTADTITNKVLESTHTMTVDTWDTPVTWDTSKSLTYDVVPDSIWGSKPLGSFNLTGIYGDPAGTGTLVINAYSGDTEVYQRTWTQQYALPPTIEMPGTNSPVNITNTLTAISFALEDISCPAIRFQPGTRALIRVTLGTTATGGGIGATTTPRK